MTPDRRAGWDRRRRRPALRFPDRRSGFDRRSPGGLLAWYRDRPLAIAATLVAILALNAADFALTLQVLDRGAREVNPIMAALLDQHPAAAGAFKLGTAGAVAAVIWRLRRYRRILGVSLVAAGGFAVLLIYQLALFASLG